MLACVCMCDVKSHLCHLFYIGNSILFYVFFLIPFRFIKCKSVDISCDSFNSLFLSVFLSLTLTLSFLMTKLNV